MSRYLYTISEKTVKKSQGVFESLDQINKIMGEGYFSSHSLSFLKYLPKAVLNLSKFKVGDKVYLNRVPEIPKSSGWFCCKHYLIPGNPGVITDQQVILRDCSEDSSVEDPRCVFEYSVKFENDTFFRFYDKTLASRHHGSRYHFTLEEDILTSDPKDYEIKYNTGMVQIKSYTVGGCLTVMIKDEKSTDWEVVWDNGKSIPRVKEVESKLCPTCGK